MNRFIDDSIYIPKIVFVDKAKINNELVTVAFPHPYGVKTLMKNHKKLSKI